ncbi:COR domain-containing protein, partial [Blastopirellula marina]
CERIENEGLAHLKELKQLQTLDLSGCERIENEGLALLKELKQLNTLDLSWCKRIENEGLAHLKELKQLQTLNLSGCKQIESAGLAHLKDLKQLQTLHLGGCGRIESAGLAHLKDLKQLQTLHLNGCIRIESAGLDHLKDLQQLQTLNLSGCERIESAGLAHLKDLKQLQTLNLSGCMQIESEGLAHLKDLKQLQMLDLSGCKQIESAGLAHLKDLKQLQTLHLNGCIWIESAGLDHLKDLQQLQTLHLSGCERIESAGLAHLKDLQQLQMLDLSGWERIESAGLAHLKDLKQLQTLHLNGCIRIGNAELLHLNAIPALRTLYVENTSVQIDNELILSGDARMIFSWLATTGKQRLRFFKLFLVGIGEVGKTHVLHRLTDADAPGYTNHEEERTTEISITKHELPTREAEDNPQEKVPVLICDCGGQDKMHQTHRFYFGGENCFYLLVVRADWPRSLNRLDYWLHFIASHSEATQRVEGRKVHAPTLILITQSDRVAMAEAGYQPTGKGYEQWDAQAVLNNYAQLENDLHRVAAASYHGACVKGVIHNFGFDSQLAESMGTELGLKIKRQHSEALSDLLRELSSRILEVPGLDTEYEPNYFSFADWVGGHLQDDPTHFNYRRHPGFQSMCAELGLNDDYQSLYLQTLRRLGKIHFVGDNPQIQRGDYTEAQQWVFAPQWLNEPVYNRILWGKDHHQAGWLNTDQYRRVLGEPRTDGSGKVVSEESYSLEEQNAIRQLLRATRVIFDLPGEVDKGMLIPDLLENNPVWDRLVSDLSIADAPYTITFKHLPERVFFAFLARHYPAISEKLRGHNCFRNAIRFPVEHPDDPNKSVEIAAVFQPFDSEDASYKPRVQFYISKEVERDSANDIFAVLKKELDDCCKSEDWKERGRREARAARFDEPEPPGSSGDDSESDDSNLAPDTISFGGIKFDWIRGEVSYRGSNTQVKGGNVPGILLKAILHALKKLNPQPSQGNEHFAYPFAREELRKFGYDRSKCAKCLKDSSTSNVNCDSCASGPTNAEGQRVNDLNKKIESLGLAVSIKDGLVWKLKILLKLD